MQGRIGLRSTDNNSGSLKGGQPAYVHAPVSVCVCMSVGVCVKTHLEAVQLEPPAVSKRDLP